MNVGVRKLQCSLAQYSFVLNQASTCLRRASASLLHPVHGGSSPANTRQYRTQPTNKIGKWKYLLPKEAPRKKKEKQLMKPISAATDTEYPTLNVMVSGYDMTAVEHFSQYIHNLCNRLGVKVQESYALPTKSTEVMVMQEQGTKMYVDSVLLTHKRVVQLSHLSAMLSPTFMEVLLKNQPEGVHLSVKEHTEADYLSRFKKRPDLEGLMAQKKTLSI